MPKQTEVYKPQGIIERLGENLKAIAGVQRKVQFREIQSGVRINGYGYNDSQWGWGTGTPGAAYDYRAAAGELWENRVVAACVNAKAEAIASAPPYLEKRNGNEWEKIEGHPVIDLLTTPNGYYSSPHLWYATTQSEVTQGQSHWRIEFRRDGTPGEIWWEDSRRFVPHGTTEEFISGYRFQKENGDWIDLENRDVIHFRYSLNPYNPREGRTPLSTGYRQVALDNGVASYSGSILRNSGVMSLLVSAKDAESGARVAPGQIEQFVTLIKQKVFGEGAGGIFGMSVPLTVERMSFSPDEMAVPVLMAYAEASICALCQVDPMVCGLGSGTAQKTYANMAEAINDFWERSVVPTNNRHNAELGAQLLPLYPDLINAATGTVTEYRIATDYSDVAALQKNVDELHARWRENYKAGFASMFDVCTALKMKTDESMKTKYAVPVIDISQPQPQSPKLPPDVQIKALQWDESKHPRAEDGKFGSGGAFDKAHQWTGDNLAEAESEVFQDGKAKALKKLLPYASENSPQEAAAVVLELDGSEYSFEKGDRKYEVQINVPADRPVAHLHTHPDPSPQSDTDWMNFLPHDSIRQAHVVAPNATYSLHKLNGQAYDASPKTIRDAYWNHLEEVVMKNPDASDQKIYEQVNEKMASRFGILFRIGNRREV